MSLRTSKEALRIDYSDLWSNWYEEGAAVGFDALQWRANDLGMLANAGAPWDQKAVARWERFVDHYNDLLEHGPWSGRKGSIGCSRCFTAPMCQPPRLAK